MQWSQLAAILFGLHMHGLTLYFTLSSLSGVHSSTLTAGFQLLTIAIPFCINLYHRETRRKLLRFELIEVLYFVFIALFLADYYGSDKLQRENFPENLLIYFCVYWFALMVGRSLTLPQLKLVAHTTNRLAILASSILLAQVATGTAMWADHGRRLVAGVSGNPIAVGYTGAYAFLSCLVMWLAAKPAAKGMWLGLSVPGLLVCVFAGTRSATLTLFVGGALLAVYFTRVVSQSSQIATKTAANTMLVVGLVLMLAIGSAPFMSASNATTAKNPSLMDKAINNGMTRIDALFRVAGGESSNDGSIEGRKGMYEAAATTFAKKPLTGNGLYSSYAAHNAFLQVSTEFGILGILSFVAPFMYVMYRVLNAVLQTATKVQQATHRINPERFIRSDFSLVTCFAIVVFVQAVCLFSFHGDPYRNYLPLCSTGALLAYLRLSKQEFTKSL
ncbi:hypothetical protein H6F89_21780 [Cyanobacteria bacterium FACHB-63]|nr:hypothetical protein [Cyanobacteria bacterium FACHB-63]